MIVIANVFPKLQHVKNFLRPLCKKRHFVTRFDTQHDKVSQILAKSPWERFYHVFSSFREKLMRNISPVLLGDILGMFLNTLTASILLKIGRICHSQFKCNYLKNRNLFLKFFCDFSNLHQTSDILKKKMMVIANVFPKLQTVKILVRPLSKNSCFRKPFDSQHVKVSQIFAKSPSEHFSHLFSEFWLKLIWKMFPIVLGEIFGVFVDTLPANPKYPVEHYENMRLPIQMQLSEKRKAFSQFFVSFLESTSNFKHFKKKDDGQS